MPLRQKKPKVNPETIRIQSLTDDCQVEGFSCGYTKIDGYFHQQSKSDHKHFETRSSVAYREGVLHPVGFYTLCLRRESSTLFLNNVSFMSRYFKDETIITAHVKWTGVDTAHQREGIGRLMFGKVIDDFYEVAIRTGIFVLTLDAISDPAVLFYEELGFQKTLGYNRKMELPIEDVIESRRKFSLG